MKTEHHTRQGYLLTVKTSDWQRNELLLDIARDTSSVGYSLIIRHPDIPDEMIVRRILMHKLPLTFFVKLRDELNAFLEAEK